MTKKPNEAVFLCPLTLRRGSENSDFFCYILYPTILVNIVEKLLWEAFVFIATIFNYHLQRNSHHNGGKIFWVHPK
jgi:hypothetical protein